MDDKTKKKKRTKEEKGTQPLETTIVLTDAHVQYGIEQFAHCDWLEKEHDSLLLLMAQTFVCMFLFTTVDTRFFPAFSKLLLLSSYLIQNVCTGRCYCVPPTSGDKSLEKTLIWDIQEES